MAAINKSIYEKFVIESADGSRNVDISAGVIAFTYFENIFSPTLTARAIVVNTGNTIKGENGKMQTVFNGLPIRGGERVLIKIAGNSKINEDGLDFSDKPSRYFHVGSVTNVLIDEGTETFTLNLVSRETITNETVKVGKKFPTSQKISDSVKNILTNYIKTDKEIIVDETQNLYGFIGNMKKPFSLITWLASKSVPGKGASKDSSAGFLFYENKYGFNFRSIDYLIEEEPFPETYKFTPGIVNSEDANRDFKILRYGINRNQDLISKLERGAFSSQRYYINPLSFKPSISIFKASNYIKPDGMSKLGSKPIDLPRVDDKSEETLGDLPTRIFVSMLDIGTIEEDAVDEGWNSSSKRNADPEKIQAQSMTRYNQLFTQVLEITVPFNCNLSAGHIVKCEFPLTGENERKEPDPETSGLYMIKELAHFFDAKGSYSKLKLVRDTFGTK